MRKEQIQKGIF